MRDNFSKKVADNLAKRVGHHCSNPDCFKKTSGPHTEPNKALNMGVAAHITAASPGGPRYDSSLSTDDRKAANNGIWLCQDCAKLIDSDTGRFTTEVIRRWKDAAESKARSEIGVPQLRVVKDRVGEEIEVNIRGSIRATSIPPFGTGEPLHLELCLTIINHGIMPIFIVSADLETNNGRYRIGFTGACNEEVPIQPGGRRKATNKLIYHDFPPHKPPIPNTPGNIEILKDRSRMEYKIIRFVCQPDSKLHLENARGHTYDFHAVEICDNSFLAWPFLIAPDYIREEYNNKNLADLEPKWTESD